MSMIITSRQNEHIAETRKLLFSKERHKSGLHIIESRKLVCEALSSGATVLELFCEESFDFPAPKDVRVTLVTRAVLESLCESKTPQGVAAVLRTPDLTPPAHYPKGLIVVLDDVQDPGNVGTILRSADALGAVGALLSPACADPFAPKTLRAAMGSTYHIPVWQGALIPAMDALESDGFTLICGHLHGSETFPRLLENAAVVIGSEGRGASEDVAARCALYRLPIRGKAESLNASAAAAILLYLVSERMPRPD